MEIIISITILISYCVLKITEPINNFPSTYMYSVLLLKIQVSSCYEFLEVEKFYSYEKLDQLFILYVTKGGGPRVQ